MLSDAFFRLIRGPVGSGKSAGCCIEIMRRCIAQEKSPIDGIRRSRWAVVRNTNPQLRTTTIKTWLDWFPEETFGKFNWQVPYTHNIAFDDVQVEVIFLALDRPEDVKKLLSLELTGVFFNEAREIPKEIIDAGTMRVGRYPSKKDGGPSWYGLIADTNAPPPDHWWAIMSGAVAPPPYLSAEEILMLVRPDDWEFFDQPGAMVEVMDGDVVTGYTKNPDAENIHNLVDGYYPKIITGKSKQWIDVYVMNRVGVAFDGLPVYPSYREDIHRSRVAIVPVDGLTVYIGIDFGLTPSAIFGHLIHGQWLIFHEIVAKNIGARQLAPIIKQDLARLCPNSPLIITGDPAGEQGAQTDAMTPFQILQEENVIATPAATNDFAIRKDVVEGVLTRLVDGKPGIIVSNACVTLCTGMAGGYHYKRVAVSGEARYRDVPDKGPYSHPCEALQYLLMGGGEHEIHANKSGAMQPRQANTGFNPFNRGNRGRLRKERRT